MHLRALGREQKGEFVDVNVSDILHNTLLLLSERMRLKNIYMHKKLMPELPSFKGNLYHLEQVFINIFQNSIDLL